jgi:hypothetical protein
MKPPIKLEKFILAAACCLWAFAAGCALRSAHATPPPAPPPSAPKPAQQPVEIAADMPISVPQTQITLPSPQPVQDEALSVPKLEAPPTQPPVPPVKPPRSVAPKPVQQTAAPPPAPQPAPPASRRRIRPVESAAERRRLTAEIASHQKQVQDNLAKAKSRQLSEVEKTAVERIQAFLEQSEAAVKEQDLQQAAALSNRALLLSQDLNSEK